MNEFYIYIYLDPREPGRYLYKNFSFLYRPFYIGKGKDNRYFSKCGRNDDFINIIDKIEEIGLEPIKFKLYENLSEEQSFEFETKLINEIGRLELGTGFLINKTSGGQGNSGRIVSDELKELVSKKLRKDFKEIKNEFERRGYELLTEETYYKNAQKKLKYICPEGHEGFISWNNFRQRHGCSICDNEKQRKNFSDIKKEFDKRSYILLTKENEYKNNIQKLKYICPNGHYGYINWSHFQQGRGCPIDGYELSSQKQKGMKKKIK